MEAGTHEAIEFTQALDDHRMLLFHNEQAIFNDGRDNQNENDEEHKTANMVHLPLRRRCHYSSRRQHLHRIKST